MENFVFPDEITTKLMNIFPILTGISQKKLQKVVQNWLFSQILNQKEIRK